MDEEDYEPIPYDLRSEARPYNGPCEVSRSAKHLVVETNMLGKLQLHPCGWCPSVFTLSETYGWLDVKNKDIRNRLEAAIKEAKKEKVPGWIRAIRDLR